MNFYRCTTCEQVYEEFDCQIETRVSRPGAWGCGDSDCDSCYEDRLTPVAFCPVDGSEMKPVREDGMKSYTVCQTILAYDTFEEDDIPAGMTPAEYAEQRYCEETGSLDSHSIQVWADDEHLGAVQYDDQDREIEIEEEES